MQSKTVPPLREKKKAECRRQILHAARDSFERNGYYATTMREIAGEAGISTASLFNYFPTKLDVMIGVEHMKVTDFARILKRESEESLSCVQQILLIFSSYMEDIYRYPRLSFELSEFHAFGMIPKYANKELRDYVAMLIEQAVANGELRDDADQTLLQNVFFSLGFSAITQKVSRGVCEENFRALLQLFSVSK